VKCSTCGAWLIPGQGVCSYCQTSQTRQARSIRLRQVKWAVIAVLLFVFALWLAALALFWLWQP
jgi:predicted nucleic acid-binding Zn ribbon protein